MSTRGGPREGAGRPEIGPAVTVRLPQDLLTRVDAYAAHHQIQRAPAIRRLITTALEDLTSSIAV